MLRTALIAAVAVFAATAAAAQSASPVRKAAPAVTGAWEVLKAGDRTVSHCVMGVRSDVAAPRRGTPQFMIMADDKFVILRVRAAEWSFSTGRDIAVTLATTDGKKRQPAAMVSGSDMIDIAFGVEREKMAELAVSSHLDIRSEDTTVRLPLNGFAAALPAYNDCLAEIGQPTKPEVHAAASLQR